MKIKFILILHIVLSGPTLTISDDEDIFTDYCRKGLCEYMGGDGVHSGCKNGVPHDGKFQQPPCPADATIIPLSEAHKKLILEFHNRQRNYVACGGLYKSYRLEPGCRIGVMSWDKELEKTAFLHTTYCEFDHDKCRSTLKYPFSGQNLGLLTFTDATNNASTYINVITYLWYLEYIRTKMDMINAYYHQQEWMVGHFLTSVNERNNRVGCSFAKFFYSAKKSNVVMLSCNYATTNMVRGTIYNSCKKPASKCTTGTDAKYKFLCSSKEIYDVRDMLDHVKYDGVGTEKFDNCGDEPELFHYSQEGADDVRKTHKSLYPDKPLSVPKSQKQPQPQPQPKPHPHKPPSRLPTKRPPSHNTDEGNPAAGGIPDYEEHEYDPPDSSSVTIWPIFYYCHLAILFSFLVVILVEYLIT